MRTATRKENAPAGTEAQGKTQRCNYTPSIRPQQCPKFGHCSAPICPVDPGHLGSCHLKGERVCFYLLELAKPGGKARLDATAAGTTPRELIEKVSESLPGVISRYGVIRYLLKRASQTPSRLGRQIGAVRKVSS